MILYLTAGVTDTKPHPARKVILVMSKDGPIGSGTKRHCFVGVGMVLLEEECHWVWDLRSHVIKPGQVWHSLSAVHQSGHITPGLHASCSLP